MKSKIKIDVISDVMCPWCFIGKKNLDDAIKQSPDIDFEVTWRPYQLDATLPLEGKDRSQYLNEKFGKDRAQEVYSNIKQAGSNIGIDFKFELIKLSPNTLNAHRLIHWAGEESLEIQDQLVERLFALFFLEGANLADNAILVEAADAIGMDKSFVEEFLQSDKDLELIKTQVQHAHEIGVTGVPFFIINRKHGIPGAVPSENLVSAFEQISKM